MTTIREVAKQAGVSYATVSHVINETRFVSEPTRARVLAAMAALNYQPNTLARSLRKGETNTLGLVLPDSANPFFAEIGRSVEDTAYRLGYSVILCNTERDTAREEHYVDVLSKKQVDGMIFVAAGDRVDSLNFLLGRDVPVILVDRDLPNIEVDAVLTDNQLGGYLATRHLIELGHRQIACIIGPSSITPGADRITGYCNALEEAGISCDKSLILSGDYHPNSGYELTCELLRLSTPPTAIFALNDLMAMGALRACLPAGTLSGAPKIRAMQIIDELEPTRRGPYGGAIGYLSYTGDLDTCIYIRSAVIKDGRIHVQAGGGIVADSEAQYEVAETEAKARAVMAAVELACSQRDWA